MRCLAVLVWVSLLLACGAPTQEIEPGEAPSITPLALEEQRDKGNAPVVIDVRSRGEYEAGHIPGAVHIPFDEVAARISEVDTTRGVALYCMVGPRARKGEAALLASGQEKVFHLDGGFSAWRSAGLPVESGP